MRKKEHKSHYWAYADILKDIEINDSGLDKHIFNIMGEMCKLHQNSKLV